MRKLCCSGKWSPQLYDTNEPCLSRQLAELVHGKIVPDLLRSTNIEKTGKVAWMNTATAYQFHQSDVAALSRHLTEGDTVKAEALVLAFVDDGYLAANTILGLMTDAARDMGELWCSDQMSFADVTIGVAGLHHILKRLDLNLRDELVQLGTGKSIMLAVMPGDTHIFGLSVLESFFRNSGWTTEAAFDASEYELLAKVGAARFDIVGLSVASREDLSRCKQIIKRLRAASLNPELKILVGGAPFLEDIRRAESLDVDGVCLSAPDALETASTICFVQRSRESENS